MDAPTGVLVADLQNGSQVFVKWEPPSGSPAGYFVYRSSSETGRYVKANANLITDARYVIPNLSLSDEIFVKVSAEDGSGVETVLSSVGEDADIDLQPVITLSARAKLGDVIAADSYFSAQLSDGVITLQIADEVTFAGTVRLWELDDNNYVEFQADKIVYVFGGVTVAEIRQEGWYLARRKIVLDELGAVVDSTEAPFEWNAGEATLYAIHTTPTSSRLMGIDTSGNMYLIEHDSQPLQLPATDEFGVIENGDELFWGNGFYQLSAIDRDEKLFFVRGRIIEDVEF
jgi:hypothetical protein